MAKFEVRIHGGSLVAEFETQQEAIDYIQNKDDPRLYVFQDIPKESIAGLVLLYKNSSVVK